MHMKYNESAAVCWLVGPPSCALTKWHRFLAVLVDFHVWPYYAHPALGCAGLNFALTPHAKTTTTSTRNSTPHHPVMCRCVNERAYVLVTHRRQPRVTRQRFHMYGCLCTHVCRTYSVLMVSLFSMKFSLRDLSSAAHVGDDRAERIINPCRVMQRSSNSIAES